MAQGQLAELARRIARLERARLAARQPSLGNSSFEGGAIQVSDALGTLRLILGQQFDGTTVAAPVSGPVPPTPSAPVVIPGTGVLRVAWDGTFSDALYAPMDFARVLVYAVPDGQFGGPQPLAAEYVVGQFPSAAGGEVTAGLDGGQGYTVYLVCWSQAGKYGAASGTAAGTPGVPADGTAIASKSGIYRQAVAPWTSGHADDEGDLWYDTSLVPGPPVTVEAWSASGGVVTLTTVQDHGLVPGAQVAVASLDAAVDGAYSVQTVPSASTLTVVVGVPDSAEAEAPAGASVQGLDMLPANTPYIWDGAAWVSVQDAGIDDAATLANGVAVEVATVAGDVEAAQDELDELQVTATDAARQAYAADGRISISDYDPTPDDVAGKPAGSLWLTRTRDRLSECPNPSFETSLIEWGTTGAALTRQASADAASGSWVAQVSNTGVTGTHELAQAADMPVSEGEQVALSGYMREVSGGGPGWTARIRFYDAGLSLLGEAVSSDVDLGAEWVRGYAVGVAPAGADHAVAVFAAPDGAASAVWQVDAVVFERSDMLGRYFDGDSEGGSWVEGGSALRGNSVLRLWSLEGGGWVEQKWTADSIQSVDASSIDRGAMNGGFLLDGTVAVDKLFVPDVVVAEDLSAGDLVNVFNEGGEPLLRRASAASVGFEAHGFVLSDFNTGEAAPVYTGGYNPLVSGLTPGRQFLSIIPGRAASAPPQEAGNVVQNVGTAVAEGTLNFAPQPGVTLT